MEVIEELGIQEHTIGVAPVGCSVFAYQYMDIGRTVETAGFPLKIADLIALLPGAYYVSRHAVHTTNAVRQLKKAITKSFQYQELGKGTCFIEVVSNCPSGWKMTPLQANKWMEENMFPMYPMGDLKAPKQ